MIVSRNTGNASQGASDRSVICFSHQSHMQTGPCWPFSTKSIQQSAVRHHLEMFQWIWQTHSGSHDTRNTPYSI